MTLLRNVKGFMAKRRSPTIVRLEKQVDRQQKEIEQLTKLLQLVENNKPEAASVTEAVPFHSVSEPDIATYPFIGYAGIVYSRTDCELIPIKFNMENGQAIVDFHGIKKLPGISNLRMELARLLVKGQLNNKLKREDVTNG